MPVKTVEARVLLGWMDRDEALAFLRKRCVFEHNLSDGAAEEIWKPCRDAVLGLNREIAPPAAFPLNDSERRLADDALAYLREDGAGKVTDVIKIDPFGLIAYQNFVLTERSSEYSDSLGTAEAWLTGAIRRQAPARRSVEHEPGTNVIRIEVPHGECYTQFESGTFAIREGRRCVVAWNWPELHRTILMNGYHRVHSQVVNAAREGGDRAVLMVQEDMGPATKLYSGRKDREAHRDILTGPNPPLFGDFFDDRLCVTLPLRKVRYQMTIRAKCVAIDDE